MPPVTEDWKIKLILRMLTDNPPHLHIKILEEFLLRIVVERHQAGGISQLPLHSLGLRLPGFLDSPGLFGAGWRGIKHRGGGVFLPGGQVPFGSS